ncbi:MAG TPA: tetratricopeptide repeat protein [Methanoregula sp.]|nr:tetratricopeptide repeat protein [Methanoregula sp.]
MARALLVMLLLLLLLLCLPAAGAAPEAGLLSAAGDTQGPPPREATAYISDAEAAVAIRNWPDVLTITTRGLAWYPDNADLLCMQGYSYRKMGHYQKSVDAISKGILADPKPVRYANRGYGYLALKNYSAALADAESGIAADSGYTTNHGVKALALQGMGRNTEALAAIDTALLQSPDSAHYWHVKGRILAAGGDCPGAAVAFEKSQTLDPDYSLPYPGFGSARENLDALDTTCRPATGLPSPTKSALGWSAAALSLGAVIAFGMRK